MSDQDSRSGSNVGVVILVALLVPAVICCGGVLLFGAGIFSFRMQAQPPQVNFAPQPMPVPQAMPMPVETPQEGPAETATSEDISEPSADPDVKTEPDPLNDSK